MFFDHYPYTNFHNVNLDWVLQEVKAWGQTVEANNRAFQDLEEANEDFKAYVTNYLQDLDITEEINTKLDAMLASGVLTPYFAPYVQGYVNSWLNSHVTPTSPALDNTLTLSGAAARADAVGHRLKDLAYIDALSTPEVVAALNRSQVLPGYRVQGITYDYDGHYYVCGGSVDEDGTGVIVKMTKPNFSDAEISVIPQLGHANDITYYDGYLYVCTVGGGNAPQWGIWKINVNDFTDKTLISNAPENTIGIAYRQGDFWILAPYRIYRTTDFTSYEVVVANTNDLMTAYGIPTSGRISQTIFRAAGYLIGWVCSFVSDERHYGALTFFNSTGEPVAFKMFPAYHSEIQGAVYADMSIYLLADGNLVNVFRMDPRNLSYVQLKAGDDLNDFTGRGTLYSTGSNVSAELLNSPSSGEGFTVQVDRLGVYNTIQTARTNSGRELYRVKSFSAGTWGEWIEPAAEVSQIKEDLSDSRIFLGADEYEYSNSTRNGITYEPTADKTRFHVYGTSTAGSFYNLYHNYTKLLNGLHAGNKMYVAFKTIEHVFARIIFYASEQAVINTENVEYNRVITIPDNAVGMTVRYYVYTGYSPNVYVNVPIIVSYEKRSLFAPVFGNAQKYISFIDDDTSSDDLVTKYYNACMHNGVKGAYAVITGRYHNNDNDINLLKTYNYNGFNTLLHCESQYQYLNTASSAFQRPRSIQNYTEAIRDFKNLNLVNPQNALVTPYGSYDDKAKSIAKDMGFDLAFSTRFTRYNTTYETDRYALYRCGLSPLASVSDDSDATARGTMATCKARVDELSTDVDGGWLIITTHFNEWAGETWDETLDTNGFPIGYARFNELVQYALSRGLTPISMAEGIAWMKKVLEKNEAINT